MKIENMDKGCRWNETEGLYKKTGTEEFYISNFIPIVKAVQETQEDKVIILELHNVSGCVTEALLTIKDLRRVDWFELCQQCIVNEDTKEAYAYLRQLVRKQVANYEGEMTKITQYTELGWNVGAYGNPVYVFGNCCIGDSKNSVIAPLLKEYELQFEEERQGELLKSFVDVWTTAPNEAIISIGYFFTGLMKQLYKDAGIPVDFVLYLLGEQQNRKTTLAKLTNNLYCRNTDMDFAVRTVEKTSSVTAEKLISMYKDTTLILDDVSKTGDKKYRQTQENVVESVTRMIGNRAKKTTNAGKGVREYLPNANVIITGEYMPNFPESTLSRMLIVEIATPVDAKWLTSFGENPQMLSTVAYSFLSWIQTEYGNVVNTIRQNLIMYRKKREKVFPFQERIQEHGFILQNTYFQLYRFLCENGYMNEVEEYFKTVTMVLRNVLNHQVTIMKKYALKDAEKDFCRTFAELYMTEQLVIAGDEYRYDKKNDDGFVLEKGIICISTGKMCGIMQNYYSDASITVHSITKQLRNGRFLKMDNSKNSKSTKKVKNERYLHILKANVKDYYAYCVH